MIDPKAITTYAQYNEDTIMLALLHDVDEGYYVDVGANYPTIDSVTKLFYERGWRGINIEPIKSLHRQLENERPEDINLQCGAGQETGKATLREYKELPGHSTFDPSQKLAHGQTLCEDYEVEIRPLKDILDEFKPPQIHFIKIDVEGFGKQVVEGNDWSKYRPEIICIEANHVTVDWRPEIAKAKYRLFIADGLNEYYVAEESWTRTDSFAERIVELDYHALKQHQQESWSKDSKDLTKLHKLVAEYENQVRELQKQQEVASLSLSLSLKNVTYFERLKRAVYGLTIDWIKYKKRR